MSMDVQITWRHPFRRVGNVPLGRDLLPHEDFMGFEP